MKKKVMILLFLFTVILCLAGCEQAEKAKTLEKNYGRAYSSINIGSDGAQALTVDEIVPSKSALVENLEKAGFAIAEYDTVLGSDMAAERVYAKKDGLFMDICYGLSEEQAKEIFANYESAYEDYYLLAQNEVFVYAVSDENTFNTAGFASLETSGILFIWK